MFHWLTIFHYSTLLITARNILIDSSNRYECNKLSICYNLSIWTCFKLKMLAPEPEENTLVNCVTSRCVYSTSIALLAPATTFRQFGSSCRWASEYDGAIAAENNALSVRKNRCDCTASRTLNIHEEGIWRLYQALALVLGAFIFFEGGAKDLPFPFPKI